MRNTNIFDRDKHRIKPALPSSAQSATLCEDRKQLEALCSQVVATIEKMSLTNRTLAMFASIQLSHALRVSELLNVKVSDIDVLGRVSIRSLKGGLPRVLQMGVYTSVMLKARDLGFVPWADFNRYYVHREYLKYGLQLSIDGNRKRATTHSLRHLSVMLLDDKSSDLSFAQSLLAHSSSSNAHIYASRKKA